MALEGTNTYMPVAPAYNGGFGAGGDWAWIIILLLAFGGGFGGAGGWGEAYPWLNNANQMSAGFNNQAINSSVSGIQQAVTAGFGDVQNALCGGFGQAEISANSRQIADLQQMFALQSQLAQCCCDNKTATIETRQVVQSEGAATRLAIQEQTQAILDKMCQQEIDNLKAQNLALQNQVNMLNLSASQTAQTAALIADNTAQTQYLINNLKTSTTAGA